MDVEEIEQVAAEINKTAHQSNIKNEKNSVFSQKTQRSLCRIKIEIIIAIIIIIISMGYLGFKLETLGGKATTVH